MQKELTEEQIYQRNIETKRRMNIKKRIVKFKLLIAKCTINGIIDSDKLIRELVVVNSKKFDAGFVMDQIYERAKLKEERRKKE